MRRYLGPGLFVVVALYLMTGGAGFDLDRSLYMLGGVLCMMIAFTLLFLRRSIDFRRVRFVFTIDHFEIANKLKNLSPEEKETFSQRIYDALDDLSFTWIQDRLFFSHKSNTFLPRMIVNREIRMNSEPSNFMANDHLTMDSVRGNYIIRYETGDDRILELATIPAQFFELLQSGSPYDMRLEKKLDRVLTEHGWKVDDTTSFTAETVYVWMSWQLLE